MPGVIVARSGAIALVLMMAVGGGDYRRRSSDGYAG